MEKKNFKAFTNLNPLKKNAIQLCGQEFVDSLRALPVFEAFISNAYISVGLG
ncbi:hypothetical protein [Coleofasciculus sp.]|uniref:hypothetical protein n=1 Tax=Coleofasciculus sp. TaxID=3100458 RepID=UPI0039FA0387